MKLKIAMAVLGLSIAPAYSSEFTAAASPLTNCSALPNDVTPNGFSMSDRANVCTEVTRILQGATAHDLNTFLDIIFVLSKDGYETGQYGKSPEN